MATVEHPRRRGAAPPVQKPPRRRRVRWYVLSGVLLLAVYLAPAIVAKTALLNMVLSSAAPVDGKLTCDSASLGWFSPVVFEKLKLVDRRDEPVASALRLSSDRSLVALIFGSRNLGTIEVRRPEVFIASRDGGSNVEDVLAPIFKRPKSNEAPPTCNVSLSDGSVHMRDAASGAEHKIEGLALSMQLGAAGKSPLALECTGKVVSKKRPAAFKVVLHARPGPEAGGFGRGDVLVDVESLPLALVEIPARRLLPGAKLDGSLAAKLSGAWGDGLKGDAGSVTGELAARGLALTADALSGDEISLRELRVPCELAIKEGKLEIRQFRAECDAGQVSLTGTARLDELSAGSLAKGLSQQDLKLAGQVDLAALAQLLPGTLRLRRDVEITGGRLDFTLASRKQADGPAWSGSLTTSDLAARAGGRNIVWQQPPNITFAARQGKDGPVVDRFRCQSSFLSIDGSGSLDELSATAQFDLGRLKTELAQFVDLGTLDMAGAGTADLGWRSDQGKFQAQARFEANGFRLAAKGRRPWTEPALDAQLDAAGTVDGTTLARLESATLNVRAAADRLRARLLQPVAAPEATPWSIDVDWSGDLAAWLPRLQSVVDVGEVDVAGGGSLTGMMTVSAKGVAIERGALDLDRPHLWAPGVYFDHPRATLRADGELDFATGELSAARAKFEAGSLSVDAKQVRLGMTAGTAGGSVGCKADLAQLAAWLTDPRRPPSATLAGDLNLQLDISPRAGGAEARLSGAIERFEMAAIAPSLVGRETARRDTRPGPAGAPQPNTAVVPAVWREPRLALTTEAEYKTSGELTLSNLLVASGALELQAGGSVRDLAGQRNVDLSGKLGYDWAKLAPLLRSLVGSELRLEGSGSQPFFVRGPLRAANGSVSWTDLAGEMAVGWSSADVLALQFGAGELAAKLDAGQIGIRPLDLPVSQGRLTLAPRIVLAPDAAVEISKGPLLSQVRLTPEICARGLKYVHPILAEATVAEGTLSIDLDGAQLPLANLAASDVGGRLRIANGEVKPGPLAEEIILIARQIEALAERKAPSLQVSRDARLKLSDQSIDARLVKGRVYHRNLEFQVGGVTVRTHGSVGLDETLALTVEVPIQDAWVAKSPALGAIADRKLQIPIGGTLSRWEIDRRALQKLLSQSIKSTARGLLLDQLDKQLEKLRPAEK